MPCFDARLIALVLKGGTGFAAFDFPVFVIGVASVEFDRGKRPLQVAYTAPDDRLPAVKLLEVLALAKRSLPLPSGSTGG
ncbi:hypothetical protein ACQX2H_12075, partial [Corynebacterium diphtheriae]